MLRERAGEGIQERELAEAVRQGLENSNGRGLIVNLLGEFEAPPEAVVPTLIRALDEESALVRFLAATTLRKIGPPAAAAIPRLTQALKDPDKDTRNGAALALASIRGK